jgi:hypothetical protein
MSEFVSDFSPAYVKQLTRLITEKQYPTHPFLANVCLHEAFSECGFEPGVKNHSFQICRKFLYHAKKPKLFYSKTQVPVATLGVSPGCVSHSLNAYTEQIPCILSRLGHSLPSQIEQSYQWRHYVKQVRVLLTGLFQKHLLEMLTVYQEEALLPTRGMVTRNHDQAIINAALTPQIRELYERSVAHHMFYYCEDEPKESALEQLCETPFELHRQIHKIGVMSEKVPKPQVIHEYVARKALTCVMTQKHFLITVNSTNFGGLNAKLIEWFLLEGPAVFIHAKDMTWNCHIGASEYKPLV